MAVDTTRTAGEVLDAEFLEVRSRLLDVAAALDRIDRSNPTGNDPRLKLLQQAVWQLAESDHERAERLQRLFSREYDADWKNSFGVSAD